ncbi:MULTISPECIES: mercuric transport protein MerTP [Leptospira]|uniref:mercuric transport protein MerTP n=1 Tax=Leptospira TaxID=171 RepID=UPI001EE82034|nr:MULTISPECIES: mercuric transport protein MerTP [Leptospira]MCG6146580.1 mercuric transport protein MerTP [Leptospira bandrabouensis]MCG6161959.1 mercuric transport protein MerTP [Leptospira bandrabouensis]MCG6166148.1 mercuric transport protein MerTP [Leptospira bandrabouensis]MCW7483248.1 mercuric transport protein MerTP [Leptospira kanakyensis]
MYKIFNDFRIQVSAGFLLAISSSLCCVSPIVGVIGGFSGIASTFTWLEPYRSFLIILSIVIFSLLWYNVFTKSKKSVLDCDCQRSIFNRFFSSKLWLIFVTFLSLFLFLFPNYSSILNPINDVKEKIESEHLVVVEFEISGMTCAGCEFSVNNALVELSGVSKVTSDYKKGVSEIVYDKRKVGIQEFKDIIQNKVGYRVINIKGERKWK